MLCLGCLLPWCLLESPFWYATLVASWVKLWYALKPTINCVGSGSIWLEFRYEMISASVGNQPWATCLKLPHCSLFVSASTGPGCAWEGPICVKQSDSSSILLRAGLYKDGLAEVYLHLSAILPPPEFAWSSSRAFWIKIVEWANAGHNPQPFPQVASLEV